MTSTTTPAPIPTQFKLPVIKIPEDVTVSQYGRLQFSITTSNDDVIACRCWIYGITCEGKLEALMAAGMLLPQWAL